MNKNWRRFVRRLGAALLVASLGVAAKGKQAPAAKRWQVRYEQSLFGAVERGTPVKVTVGKETVVCEPRNQIQFSE